MSLVPCPGCARHVKPDEVSCPFCARPAAGRAWLGAAAVAAAVSLSGCPDRAPPRPVYGLPPSVAPVASTAPPAPGTDERTR